MSRKPFNADLRSAGGRVTLLSRLSVGSLHPWQTYLLAVVATFATLGARLALDPMLQGRPTLLMFALPIMLSGYVGGLRAGLVATATSYLLASYFLLPPIYSFAIASSPDRWQQFFIVLVGVVISLLNEALHRARRIADIALREQQESKESLRNSNALQSAIFNSVNFSSIATDANGVIQIFNVGAERMLGYTAAEVMDNITPADISDPAELVVRAAALSVEFGTTITPGFEALIYKAARSIEDIYELTQVRKDGSRFPALVSVTALRDANENIIGYLLIGTDNTARKHAEQALVEAGALQNAIFNSANFSSIATDEKGVIQIFNVGAERMLGYTAAEVMNKITPADISDPQEVVARAGALSLELGTTITPGFEALVFKASRGIEDIYELTYIRKDGSRFPALVSVTALRDAQENIIGYLLIGTDNTIRRQADEALRDTDALLRTIHMHSIVSVADRAGHLVDVNDSFCEISGYSRDELIGQTHRIINSGVQSTAFWIDMWTSIAAGKPWRGEICNRAKSGSLYWVDSIIVPFTSENGQVKKYISIQTDITASKVLVEKYRASEARLDLTGTLAAVGGWEFDVQSQVLTWAEQTCRLHDVEPGYQPTLEEALSFYPPEARLIKKHAFAQAIEHGIGWDHELPFVTAKGRQLWVRSVGSVEREEGKETRICGILQDISERKRSDESRRATEARYGALFQCAPDGIVVADSNSFYLDANDSICEMLGYTRDEFIGLHATDIVTEPEMKNIDPALDTIQNESGYRREWQLRRKDGSVFDADVIATKMPDGNILGMIRDITQRKLSDQVLMDTNASLELAKSAAEKANLAKSDFLSSMSHELRSPLNAILGFAQLMESAVPPPTDSQTKSIAQIIQAGWYLLQLINEVLDLAVIESGSVSLSCETVSLDDLMLECNNMMEPLAEQRGIRMNFSRFDNGAFVTVDRTRLKQIIINLISNAIKYNREHGTVTVDCLSAGPGRFRISVTDTGMGLSSKKVAQLFSPFNRLGQEAGNIAGTGIGLVVCKRLAELMGGAIGVESIEGVGSTFWCDLSAAEEPRMSDHAGELTVIKPQVSLHRQPRTLLYVEDNPANLLLIEELIGRFPGLEMMTATDATVGIELARVRQPHVILMDINLPGISGLKALKILRDDPVTAHIPVIALSANAMAREIAKGLEAGFFRYLTKPIKIKEFMETLNAAMDLAEKPTVHCG
jgi:PAS domain S-box-containing protein